MKVKELVEELESADTGKQFKQEHADAFLAAGFFILDLKEERNHKIQLDYFLPKEQKVAGFEHPFKQVRIFEDLMKEMTPLSTDVAIDLDSLVDTCKKAMKDSDIHLNPTKIIAVLRDNTWNATCMNEALGIVRIHINAQTGRVESVNKGSLMDFMGFKKPR